jgi:hypothetical protein
MDDELRSVPIDELHFTKRTDNLPPELVNRITLVHHAFRDYLSPTLAETINNFTFDEHPEQEVEIWERMAAVAIALRYEHAWPTSKMASAVKAVVGLSVGTLEQGELSDDETAKIIELWNNAHIGGSGA